MDQSAPPAFDDHTVYERMFVRERAARKEAERLLEEKSCELYETNQELKMTLVKQRRESFYQSVILETVKDGILTIGADGLVKTANPSACQLFGYSPSDFDGIPAEKLLSTTETQEKPSPANHFLADYCDASQPVIEAIGCSANGDTLTLEFSASYGEFENHDLITWVVRDVGVIDAIKRQSNLSQRLEGIGELAAGIAHEINTPIQFVIENIKFLGEAYAAIHGVLDIYQSGREPDESLKATLEAACPAEQLSFYLDEVPDAISETKSGAARIGEIVAAIKEFAHPGTDSLASVNLNDLVNTAITVTANNCKYVATVDTRLGNSLPLVPCYRSQITQVLVNLIVNAADAIAESHHSDSNEIGSITIETGQKKEHAFISVSDSGCGIDPEIMEKIFLPFFTTKDVGKGTGQGLAITHSIVVENHQGKLDIESEPGKGTKFTVLLPLERPE